MDNIFTGSNWRLISTRLRSRLILFLVIAVALVVFAIYEVIIGDMDLLTGVLTLLVGAVFGFIYGRLIRVRWNEDEEKIITRMDTVGFIIIAIYLILSYFRETLLAHFFSGTELTAIGVTLAGGILIGRFFGVHVSLMRLIREHRAQKAA
jgi:hypothetical protein